MIVVLPFDQAQFLDAFAIYNTWFRAVVLIFWLASATVAAAALRGTATRRTALALLACQWAWVGVAYHALTFTSITPLAWLFAGLFLIEAWALWRVRDAPASPPFVTPLRRGLGAVLVSYALAYPLLSLLSGLQYPGLPLFAVPCPLVILTAGLLVRMGTGLPRSLLVIPIVWSIVGGSAVVLFGMTADLGLLVAGAVMVVDWLSRRTDRQVWRPGWGEVAPHGRLRGSP